MAGLPPKLKALQPYVTLSRQFAQRDPVVAYFAKMYAVQEGLSIAKGDPTAKAYLLNLMDELQTVKAQLKAGGEEAVSSDVVAQAHVEEAGLNLFDFADKQDRAGNFHKNMIKAFFMSSHILTTLKQFGELAEGVEEKTKYAKWKAVEIDRCLKSGITPTAGPPGGQDDFFGSEEGGGGGEGAVGWSVTPPEQGQWIPPGAQLVFPPAEKPVPKPRHQPPAYHQPEEEEEEEASSYQPPAALSGVTLGPEQVSKAQKLCKFAMSSLDYDDTKAAIDYLTQAVHLLKTGREPQQ